MERARAVFHIYIQNYRSSEEQFNPLLQTKVRFLNLIDSQFESLLKLRIKVIPFVTIVTSRCTRVFKKFS